MEAKRIPCSAVLLLLLLSFYAEVSEAKRKVSIPDELSDVVDDEEDEAWKEWGKKRPSPAAEFDPPPYDFDDMSVQEIQAEMLKRHVGPSFGFVKLRSGVRRSPIGKQESILPSIVKNCENSEDVPEIATRWSKILRTGSVEAKFMAVDMNTIMFTLEKGQDTVELKDFILGQPEAYEVKIGEQLFRRPGDPPLDEVVEMLRREKDGTDKLKSAGESDQSKDEL